MITLLANEYPPVAGGVATYMHQVACAIKSAGFQIDVIAAGENSETLEFDRRVEIPIYRVKEYRLAPLRHAARLSVLSRKVADANSSVIWASDWRAGLTAMLIAMRYRIPYFVSAHGSEILLCKSDPVKSRIARSVYFRSSKILAVSHYTRSLLLNFDVPNEKITVTTLGVDPNSWPYESEIVGDIKNQYGLAGKKVVVSLARLTPRKGHDIVIQALPEVLKSVPNIAYMVAGQGEDLHRLKTLTQQLNVSDQVIFTGYIEEEEKPSFYHASDLFVQMSRQEGYFVEGFGLSILEAGACGKPVIVGNHGGTSDAVLDGMTGLLVNPEDVQAVAQAIIRILSDQELADRMGSNAKEHIRTEANWNAVARNTLNIFGLN